MNKARTRIMFCWMVLTAFGVVRIMYLFHYTEETLVYGEPTAALTKQVRIEEAGIEECLVIPVVHLPGRTFLWDEECDWDRVSHILIPFGVNLVCFLVVGKKWTEDKTEKVERKLPASVDREPQTIAHDFALTPVF